MSAVALDPRKQPVQARAVVSVEAILEATLQVLLELGQAKLTTTRVAERAGVSVGTLYQYFPNKTALLQTLMERHLTEIAEVVEAACATLHGQPLETMAEGFVGAFLRVKLGDYRKSMALYGLSGDVDRTVVERAFRRNRLAIAAMLETSPVRLRTDAELVASVLVEILSGVVRRIIEAEQPKARVEAMRRELVVAVKAYLLACV